MSYESAPRPAMTADTVVIAGPADDRRVLLIRRGRSPYPGAWALPGGFLEPDEPPVEAARRELLEETGLSPDARFDLVGVYGEPGRDPRGWTVSVAYVVDVGEMMPAVCGDDDAEEASWHPLFGLPPLAFDHDRIVADAVAHLGG